MKDDKVYLQHILEEVEFVIGASAGLGYDDLLKDGMLQRAILRSLEIIGEASKQISQDFKNGHPEVEWKAMAGLRDKLIHSYFSVDLRTVWSVMSEKLPQLKRAVESILRGK